MIKELINEIKEYAINNKVPIMMDEASDKIIDLIKQYNLTNVLELGTAIGYTAIKLSSSCENINIISIERDEIRYKKAQEYINRLKINNIKLIFDDIYNVSFDEKFDLIIIDAAKAQNKNFFEKFKNNLTNNGIIIIDNLSFHGLVGSSNEIKSKNLRQLVKKIEKFIVFLKSNQEFNIEFLDIGDGIAICRKIKY